MSLIRFKITRPKGKKGPAIVVRLLDAVEDLKGLNAAMGAGLNEVLREHFAKRDAEGNKNNWRRSHFWSKRVRANTVLADFDDKGATVNVGEPAFHLKVRGGTIRPTGGRKWLTIPINEIAAGRNVSTVADVTGVVPFRLPGTNVLAIVKSGELVNVFALKKEVTQGPDKQALPEDGVVLDELDDVLGDYFDALEAERGLS